MRHKTFQIILKFIFVLAVFWKCMNSYCCYVTISFTSDGDKCSTPLGYGFEVHFWTDGLYMDEFTEYTDVNGQIIHDFTYCSQRYFLEDVGIDCQYGGCINQFKPENYTKNGLTLPYECYNILDTACYCDKDNIITLKKGINNKSQIRKYYSLQQNYPNPFNPVTNIKFDLPKDDYVKLVIYELSGKEVVTLIDELLTAGSHSIDFDGSTLSSGVYIYKLETADFTDMKKMVLVK